MLKSIVIQYAIVSWFFLDSQFDELYFIIYLFEPGIYQKKEVEFYLYYVCLCACIYMYSSSKLVSSLQQVYKNDKSVTIISIV